MTTPPDPARPDAVLSGRHVLLGVSGGIAAYKAAALARGLRKAGASVQVVLTRAATEFVGPATFAGITGWPAHASVFDDPERILHVQLAREADLAIFAPATAHTIARFAHGLADDLVTNAYLTATCPVVVAPAMHTEMWEHPATRRNMETIESYGYHVVGPETGALAGGDTGMGRVAEPDTVVEALEVLLAPVDEPLRVLVTAGGTREPLDPVRYLGNRSSGKQGYALARTAAARGARVTLIAANATLPDPAGVDGRTRARVPAGTRPRVVEPDHVSGG